MPDIDPDEARRKVLEKWPEAVARLYGGFIWLVSDYPGNMRMTLGRGPTEPAAWLSAAKKLGDGKNDTGHCGDRGTGGRT